MELSEEGHPVDGKFHVIWKTAREPKGTVAVTVAVTVANQTTSTEIATFELV